jgi:hypothetical protein
MSDNDLKAEASSNIRELEGALNVIICQTNLKNKELSLNEIKNIVKETTKPKRSISIKEVIKTISDFYDIPEDSIYEKSRRKEVVKPRQVIMYILREDFKISYPTIGEKLGGRDHTMDTFVCSSFYYLKYLAEGKKDAELIDPKIEKKWMPVSMYIGGPEHACMHLIYARFVMMAHKKQSLQK